jgi:hypothetical protein
VTAVLGMGVESILAAEIHFGVDRARGLSTYVGIEYFNTADVRSAMNNNDTII